MDGVVSGSLGLIVGWFTSDVSKGGDVGAAAFVRAAAEHLRVHRVCWWALGRFVICVFWARLLGLLYMGIGLPAR